MSREQELSNAIDAYLDKSIMPLPEGHPMRPDRGYKPMDLKDTLRQVGEALGVVKPKPKVIPKETDRYAGGGGEGFVKARAKTLKPGSPEHDRAMAEMEAAKAGKPKSTNPAGVESPSAPGSRDKLGERPLVEGIDKHFTGGSGLSPHETGRSHVHEGPENAPRSQAETDASFKRAEAASATWTPEQRRRKNPLYGRNPDTPNAAFPKMTDSDKEMFTQNSKKLGWDKPLSEDSKPAEKPFYYSDDMKKSMDLEESSRSWSYQG